jgi:uncharacterized membrane protein YdjX (TVP38/TMEM64 family)
MNQAEDPNEKRRFILSNLWKGLVSFLLILAVLFLGKRYIGDHYLDWLIPLTSQPLLIYAVFLLSETVVGIIPPEFFMMWALEKGGKSYVYIVLLLAGLSYLGGIVAFWFGKRLYRTVLFQRLEKSVQFQKYLNYYRHYGGILILIAAVTPLPFALISIVSGSLGYRFRRYFQFASFRILRFVVYGAIIWFVNSSLN